MKPGIASRYITWIIAPSIVGALVMWMIHGVLGEDAEFLVGITVWVGAIVSAFGIAFFSVRSTKGYRKEILNGAQNNKPQEPQVQQEIQ